MNLFTWPFTQKKKSWIKKRRNEGEEGGLQPNFTAAE